MEEHGSVGGGRLAFEVIIINHMVSPPTQRHRRTGYAVTPSLIAGM